MAKINYTAALSGYGEKGFYMNKTSNIFAVTGSAVGRSFITQPKTNYTGKRTKWFDDSQLIKKPIAK